jgi:hypothetical protein
MEKETHPFFWQADMTICLPTKHAKTDFFLPGDLDQDQYTSDARSETSVGTSPELRTWVAAAAGTWWAATAGTLRRASRGATSRETLSMRNEETSVRA